MSCMARSMFSKDIKKISSDAKKVERVFFHEGASWLELLVDRLVPYVLLFVLIIFIGELIFPEFFEPYHKTIFYFDIFLVTGVMGLDLVYKYIHAKSHKNFLKKHWLDIIAVFPFFMIFRIFDEFLFLSHLANIEFTVKESQALTHELRGFQEAQTLVREAEIGGELSRVARFKRWVGAFFRSPRIYAGASFYEKPVKKEVKLAEKEIVKIEKTVKKEEKKIISKH